MDEEESVPAAPLSHSAAHAVARIETIYLAALRVLLLLLATLAIVYAAWLAASGLYHVSRDAASVKEQPVVVTGVEVAAQPAVETVTTGTEKADPWSAQKAYYKGFVDRYYAVFNQYYAPYRQRADSKFDRAGFDERYVRSANRVEAIASGDLVFAEDKDALERLLATMRDASALPDTRARLQRYRSAIRTKTTRTISGTRPERYCSYFGYYIGECITYDTRQVPYSRTIVEMRLPKGVIAPRDLFQGYQDRFFSLLTARSEDARRSADRERDRILDGNAAGSISLASAIQFAGGFLLIMFLFLLIAIERHQRKLATAFPDNRRAEV